MAPPFLRSQLCKRLWRPVTHGRRAFAAADDARNNLFSRNEAIEKQIHGGTPNATVRLDVSKAPTAEAERPRFLTTPLLQPIGKYSHIAVHRGVAYVSGILPLTQNPMGPDMAAESVDKQAAQALANLQKALKAAGLSLNDVLKMTVYITDVEANWPVFDKVYAKVLQEAKPARCVVPVPALPDGYACQIECIAAVSN
eukprot:TRINITY_DN17925_c0_g1_i1.p1 TRINITY_DN17925_c0_g1~~TRINITY_DN17925_c0_g1_i1.p1  ORF type:complete len:198 (-),score=39.67 TRINITY_DN17925_c0_g1_i1:142-735(-)